MTNMRRIFLSIDWDFFIREDHEWDFSHRESGFFTNELWTIRSIGFAANGGDLIDETDPDKHADPKPSEFWDKLEGNGFLFDDCRIVVADSHAEACLVALIGNHDVVVNFDAHCDLGYSSLEVHKKRYREKFCMCDDWLLQLMWKKRSIKSKIVYPKWKGMADWSPSKGGPKAVARRTEVGVWSDDLLKECAGTVSAVFICRSGAWTHPAHDEKFIEFVRSAERALGVRSYLFPDEKDKDVLVPRRFDVEAVKNAGIIWKDQEDIIRRLNENQAASG